MVSSWPAPRRSRKHMPLSKPVQIRLAKIKVYDETGYLVATVDFLDMHEEQTASIYGDDELPAEEPGVIRSG